MDQTPALAETADGQVTTCGYCPSEVVFWPTVFSGHALCFDARVMDTRNDRRHTGWVPLRQHFGTTRPVVFSPLVSHPERVRRRFRTVWQLHICAGMTKGAAA
ncbi:MAG: hypothetical protein ABWX96_17605 [Propionibacteriaceae bacterium]